MVSRTLIKSMHNKRLFDGSEEDIIKLSFTINNKEFGVSSFINNPLRNLVEQLIVSQEDFERIITAGDFRIKESLFKTYYYQENLEVYYMTDNSQIYICAFGEFQPARFILYIESVWNL